MNLKRIASIALALMIILMTASVAFAGGDCACDMKYKYKKYKDRATCISYGHYDLVCTKCGHSVACLESPTPEGHDWIWTVLTPSDCTHKGERKGACKICGTITYEETNYSTHAYSDWEITVEATPNSNGLKSRTCAECGKVDTREYEPDGVLRRSNDKSEAVRDMQQKLIDLGYLSGRADGIFGNITLRAVNAFQADHGMEKTEEIYPIVTMWLDLEWDRLNGLLPEICAVNGEGGVTECAHHREMRLTGIISSGEAMLEVWKAEYDRAFGLMFASADDSELLAAAGDYWFDIYTAEKLSEQYADNEAALTKALADMYADSAERICAIELGE